MNATSVQSIENVKEMHFTIEKACTDEISKVIVGASTNDDIFEFHFSGVGCDVFADQWFNMVAEKAYKVDFESEKNKRKMMETENAILREKNHKLQEENEKLKKQLNAVTLILDNFRKDHEDILKTQREKHKDEVEQLKQHLKQVEKDKERLTNRYNALSSNYEKEISKVEKLEKDLDKKNTAFKFAQKSAEYWADKTRKLEKAFNFEKAANEAQHKFIMEYAGKGTEVEFNYVVNESENEVSYVIVDKEEKEKIYKDEIVALIHGVKYTVEGLVDRILDLEKLKTPIIENFADEQPSSLSRADILDQAKKCVCGQREQDYGTPESNFQLIADLWNGYLGEKTDNPVISVTPVDVSMMMSLMKIARIRNGGGSGDSFVDLAGYAACGGEIWALQKETN